MLDSDRGLPNSFQQKELTRDRVTGLRSETPSSGNAADDDSFAMLRASEPCAQRPFELSNIITMDWNWPLQHCYSGVFLHICVGNDEKIRGVDQSVLLMLIGKY